MTAKDACNAYLNGFSFSGEFAGDGVILNCKWTD